MVTPVLALLWDPAMRAVSLSLDASHPASVAALILLSSFTALVLGPPLNPNPPCDPLLFSIPLINASFFSYNAAISAYGARLPSDLKLFVVTLALCATLTFARACGLMVRHGGDEQFRKRS